MINARAKGLAFERRIAKAFRAKYPDATVRRSQQAHQAFEPDVVIEGKAPSMVKALWIECHHGKTAIAKKYQQAERDAAAHEYVRVPVVIWRRNNGLIQVTTKIRFDACHSAILATASFSDWLEELEE
jgi:hypothetical protein